MKALKSLGFAILAILTCLMFFGLAQASIALISFSAWFALPVAILVVWVITYSTLY